MKKLYEIDIYGLSYGGSGVGKIDGKVHFISGALPGERVCFVKQVEKKRFVTGLAVRILTASGDRIKPVCSHYGKCGGCQYQHLDYKKEVFYKGEQVKEILRRIGGFDEYGFEDITASPSEYGYRSSITLHRSKDDYGYFAKDNKTIIPVKGCPLAEDGINSVIDSYAAYSDKKDITLKCDQSGKVWIKGYPGHRFFKDDFLGTRLTFSPSAFSQANRLTAAAMVERLRSWMKEEKREVLFDFYCGVGFFGMLMRDLFESVIGIDDNRVALECAVTSKKDLAAKNTKFYCSKAENKLPECYEGLRGEKNTILLDPPRSGITGKFAVYLSELEGADSLYYVSCDPATLARDAKIITKNGAWTLDRVACFDMFARTKHIESIAVFKSGVCFA